MALPESVRSRNSLLNALLPLDREARLARSLRLREYAPLTTVFVTDGAPDEVFFPIEGMLSAIVSHADGMSVDVGGIGAEGAVGIAWLYSEAPLPELAYRSMIASTVLAAPFPLIDRLVRSSERARRVVDRFFRARFDATLQLSACSASHPILQRAARLVLELTRSSGRDEVGITHETLAAMLGTRRASITVALSALNAAGALETMRASLVVRDRASLEDQACSCYRAIANIYGSLGVAYDRDASAFPGARKELRFG